MNTDLQSVPQQQGVGHKRPPVWTRFAAGQSGNPGGRPKGRVSTTVILDRFNAMPVEELRSYEPRNAAEAACKVQILNAIEAEPLAALPSFREVTDRTEGKAVQRAEITAIPPDDAVRVEAAILRVIQATGCERQIAERAILAQPEFQVIDSL